MVMLKLPTMSLQINDFEIDLNQFDDTTVIQNGTVIAAQQTEIGGLSGSFERLDATVTLLACKKTKIIFPSL